MKFYLNLEPGTSVSFEGDASVYQISYKDLLQCGPDCDWDHDHYPEPYVGVTYTIGTALPLSKLQHVFDPITHYGRKFDPKKDICAA